MKRLTAIIGAAFVMLVVYLVVWFVARNLVAGLGEWGEMGGHALVLIVALAAGVSSYRASMRRAAG